MYKIVYAVQQQGKNFREQWSADAIPHYGNPLNLKIFKKMYYNLVTPATSKARAPFFGAQTADSLVRHPSPLLTITLLG